METAEDSLDWGETIGSWLNHGPSGLALGLVVGVLLGIAGIRFNVLTVDALKLSLRYGLLFLIVASAATTIPLFLNPTLKVNVVVRPDIGAADPRAAPTISSSLTKRPVNGIVEVSQRDANNSIFVDVGSLLEEVNSDKIRINSEAIGLARDAQVAVPGSLAIPATEKACANSNEAVCGWTHLADSDPRAGKSRSRLPLRSGRLPPINAHRRTVGLAMGT